MTSILSKDGKPNYEIFNTKLKILPDSFKAKYRLQDYPFKIFQKNLLAPKKVQKVQNIINDLINSIGDNFNFDTTISSLLYSIFFKLINFSNMQPPNEQVINSILEIFKLLLSKEYMQQILFQDIRLCEIYEQVFFVNKNTKLYNLINEVTSQLKFVIKAPEFWKKVDSQEDVFLKSDIYQLSFLCNVLYITDDVDTQRKYSNLIIYSHNPNFMKPTNPSSSNDLSLYEKLAKIIEKVPYSFDEIFSIVKYFVDEILKNSDLDIYFVNLLLDVSNNLYLQHKQYICDRLLIDLFPSGDEQRCKSSRKTIRTRIVNETQPNQNSHTLRFILTIIRFASTYTILKNADIKKLSKKKDLNDGTKESILNALKDKKQERRSDHSHNATDKSHSATDNLKSETNQLEDLFVYKEIPEEESDYLLTSSRQSVEYQLHINEYAPTTLIVTSDKTISNVIKKIKDIIETLDKNFHSNFDIPISIFGLSRYENGNRIFNTLLFPHNILYIYYNTGMKQLVESCSYIPFIAKPIDSVLRHNSVDEIDDMRLKNGKESTPAPYE